MARKMIRENNDDKVYFFQRLFAFLLDAVLVYLISSLISSPFIDTKLVEKYSNETSTIVDKFTSNKISSKEYFDNISLLTYKTERCMGIYSFCSIFISILYYVVYQLYSGGQTLGKKIMKIKIISLNDDFTMNQMIFRSFIANFILVDIISFAAIIFCPKNLYFGVVGSFEMIQYLLVFISVMMILYGKNGSSLHDKIMHTKVVKVK